MIPDLPNEEWVPIQKIGCEGLLISTMGRVKSVRRKKEKLVKLKMISLGKNKKPYLVASNRKCYLQVHMEVLRAFRPNPDGDVRAVFLDKDHGNCKLENLVWYGREYMVDRAIEMAFQSTSPLAESFIEFWDGNPNALNGWFEEQKVSVRRFLRARLDSFSVPYYIDTEDLSQEVMVAVFVNLRRGMIESLDGVQSWVFGIAKNLLANGIRDVLPAISMYQESDEGEFNVLDTLGCCHQSAELQAIYNESKL